MTTVRPFFLLLDRAAAPWMGAFAWFLGALLVAGVANADDPSSRYLDATFIATVWFLGAAGWLAGLVIQEFQHTSFANSLPSVRFRIAAGYLTAGLVVTVVVGALVNGTSSTSPGLLLTFALGLGAYCVGGVLQDPLSSRMTAMNAVLAILVIVRSRDLAWAAGEHPWLASVVAFGIGAVGLRRLVAPSTFRRKPFRLSKPLPGRFSLERFRQYESQQRVRNRARTTNWRAGYIGSNSWSWVRAALHETHGAEGWKARAQALSRLWGLGVLVLLSAWLDKGEMAFGEAVGRTLYDTLFRSPHQAGLGETGGPYLMVVIVIAAAGVVTALLKAVALGDARVYPLSRRQRARVAFRAGLLETGFFLFVLGPGLYAIGHVTGLLVGYEARFDFMPFYFRVLMVTLVLMPLGHWGRLHLQAATRRKTPNLIVAIAFGVTGFVVVVFVGVLASPQIFVSPALELTGLGAALLISRLIYLRKLTSYYRTADLA